MPGHQPPAPPAAALNALAREPAVLRQLLAALQARYTQAPADARLLWRLAELHRSLGEYAAAAERYAEGAALASADARFTRRQTLVTGGADIWSLGPGPVPFRIERDVFDPPSYAQLWGGLEAAESTFGKSRVVTSEGTVEVPATRQSMCRPAQPSVRELVLPVLRRYLGDIARYHVEMQITSHLDGGFFASHRDASEYNARRRLTFVYYVHRRPARFSGGDLLLFDEPGEGDGDTGYSRVRPDDNTLVLFPSAALHQVTPVHGGSRDLLDGRLTVNGWLVEPEPESTREDHVP